MPRFMASGQYAVSCEQEANGRLHIGRAARCESSAPQQILKALVGAQIIPFRVDRQKSHPYVLLFQSLYQPRDCLVGFAESVV